MENKKLINVLEAIVIIIMGILIAILGTSVINTYFGIVLLVSGVLLFTVNIILLAKNNELAFGSLFSSFAFITLGIAFLAGTLGFEVYITLIVLLIIALGGALVFYGIFNLVNKETTKGAGQLVIGIFAATIATLYLTVPQFRTVFWIIVGILLAVYGLFFLIVTLTDKKLK